MVCIDVRCYFKTILINKHSVSANSMYYHSVRHKRQLSSKNLSSVEESGHTEKTESMQSSRCREKILPARPLGQGFLEGVRPEVGLNV